MTKLLLITSVVLFTLFHSCEKEDKYKLDTKYKIVLKRNDTITFKSKNSTSKFYLDNIFPINLLGYEISDAIYVNMNKSYQDSLGAFRITRGNDFFYFKIGNNGIFIDLFKNITDTTLIICNKKIFNVFTIVDTTHSKHLSYTVKKVLYCDKYGILQYEKYSGEIFKIDTNYLKKYLK